MLVLWSVNSVDSDWVRSEARVGKAGDKLIAVQIESCNMPLEFSSTQAVELFDTGDLATNEQWHRVVARIGMLIGRPGLEPYLVARAEGSASGWRSWLEAHGEDDPLAANARQFLAALDEQEAPPPPPPVVEEPVDAEPEPVEIGNGGIAQLLSGNRRIAIIGGVAVVLLLLANVAFWRSQRVRPADTTTSEEMLDEALEEEATGAADAAVEEISVPASTPTPLQTPAASWASLNGDTPVASVTPVPVATPPPAPDGSTCYTGPYIAFFEWDSADLTPEAAEVLDSAVNAYANCGNARITLAGHTDAEYPDAYSYEIASRRNVSEGRYLVSHGIPARRIQSHSFGETQPRVPTEDGVRELQNRRVEINFVLQ